MVKATGIVRRVDALGRIAIPKELRNIYDIKEGDPLEIFAGEGQIVLKPYRPGCSFCSNIEGVRVIELEKSIRSIVICPECLEKIMTYVNNLGGVEQ